MIIEHGGHRFEIYASGAMRWNTTLLVADLHLGKESVFQKSGLAIPSGATERTLRRLVELLEASQVEKLVVLGDLLHAPAGWTVELEEMLADAIQHASGVRWELVAGNHDRRSHDRLRSLGWIVHTPPVSHGAMRWLHEPPQESLEDGARTALCGHLHPSYKVPLDSRRTARFPCFWIREESIVLPAFGGWVGTYPIEPGKSDRIVLCVEDQLIEWKC